MKISMVVAMSESRAIGLHGQLPWHLPCDLKRFKAITMGKSILMGRKTFQSINKPLPGRQNLVLTTDATFAPSGVKVLHSFEEVMDLKLQELFVIGGEEIYRLFLPKTCHIYLTLVHAQIMGDVHFPVLVGFKEISREDHSADEKHQFSYSFIEYVREF